MNVDKLRSIVSKTVAATGALPQAVYDMYFFERFLYRLAKSRYKYNFVFKGGFLLENMLGIKARTTKDIDLNAEHIEMDDDFLVAIFNEICKVETDDEVTFTVIGIERITAETKYEGKSIKIESKMHNLKRTFGIDIACGDVVTPAPVEYEYRSRIDGALFTIAAYTIETIIAEKFEAFISLGTRNSRTKDWFDIYLLMKKGYDADILKQAIINTFKNRNTPFDIDAIKTTIDAVYDSHRSKDLFEKYSEKKPYTTGVGFDEVIKSINLIYELLK